jgi:S1-C subfamily serine protease
MKEFKLYFSACSILSVAFLLIAGFVAYNSPVVRPQQTTTYQKYTQILGSDLDLGLGANVSPSIRDAYQASIAILSPMGKIMCSGTIIKNQPGEPVTILTAWHCVEKAFPNIIPVGLLYNGQVIQTIVFKKAEAWDIVLLAGIDPVSNAGPSAKLSLRAPRIGDPVWIIGNPRGLLGNVTKGILSNILHVGNDLRYYRTDAVLFYGNSGGGMFNRDGELIGVADAVEYSQNPDGSSQLVPGGNLCVSLYNIALLVNS